MKKLLVMGGAALVVISMFTPLVWAAANSFDFEVVMAHPDRTHLVQPGNVTTFVLYLKNKVRGWSLFNLRAIPNRANWDVSLYYAQWEDFQPIGEELPSSFWVEPDGIRFILAKIKSPTGAPESQLAAVTVICSANNESTIKYLKARIHDKPKIYYVAIDALGRDYLNLNKQGGADNVDNNPLMPNARAFKNDSAYFNTALCLLPSATDMNHSAALTGSWPGTSGIYSVGAYYTGWDWHWVYSPPENDGEDGHWEYKYDEHWVYPDNKYLKYGANGDKVLTIFDVAKDPAKGGHEEVYTAFISGKLWLNGLFKGSADLIANTAQYKQIDGEWQKVADPIPYYLTPVGEPHPEDHPFEDPPSDDNPAVDKDGQNPDESGDIHVVIDTELAPFDEKPVEYPYDRWVAEGALKIIAAEDPAVIYIMLAAVDDVQHAFGAADRSGEWTDTGDLGNDINTYNERANREVTLDIVHEADACFGLVINALKERDPETHAAYNNSIVVLLADHGQVTYMEDWAQDGEPDERINEINIGELACELLDLTIDEFKDVFESFFSAGGIAGFFARDKSYIPLLEDALETYWHYHSRTGWTRPFYVINRIEMDLGYNYTNNRFLPFSPIADWTINKKGELYSEFYIEHYADNPYPDDLLRWPDCIVFLDQRPRLQMEITNTKNLGGTGSYGFDSFIGGHGSFETRKVPLAIRGPYFENGEYGVSEGDVTVADIVPTLYQVLGWQAPGSVDGRVRNEILK
ncbi:MAG: hypothetical protein GTN76_08780 [Candidatus Aenigmarchaeota archaeon]|nr:hypothetical protein [Candidatus Aenigmarchaeota archaeon]